MESANQSMVATVETLVLRILSKEVLINDPRVLKYINYQRYGGSRLLVKFLRSLVYQMFNYDLYITDVLTVLTSSLKLLTYIKWLAPRKAI